MTTTIDKGGRLVVPKQLREQFHLLPGTEVEVTADMDGIRVRTRHEGAALVRKHGFLVHHGPDVADIDVVSFIASERENRGRQVVAGRTPS